MYKAHRHHNLFLSLIRILLGLVFIFSGFVKGVDPWGTAIKLGEYFNAFHMEWLKGAEYGLSIALSAVETWLGLLLVFNLSQKFASFSVMVFMLCFTGLTLFIALTNPVSDCGCFGDAIKLTNWQTFYKNIVLLPLSVILYWRIRREFGQHPVPLPWINIVLLVLAILPGVTSLRYLPLIDFLPYKVGVNIAESMSIPTDKPQGEYKTTLIYKNLQTGETREFEVSDTTWQNAELWEFVDSRSEEITAGYVPPIADFVIFDQTQDMTAGILSENEIFLFVADRIDGIDAKDAARIKSAAQFARQNGIRTACLTTSPLEQCGRLQSLTGMEIPCYNIDATTLKTLIRAHKGLVILNRGTIIAKMNLRDVPDFGKAGSNSALGYVFTADRQQNETGFVTIWSILILVVLVIRYKCKK